MSDKKVEIEFKTTADTSGATEAAGAIDNVKDSAQDASQAVKTMDDGQGLKSLPAEAGQAAQSIDQLEENVRKLEKELRQLPVGSKEFTAMGERVKAARKEFGAAEADLKKLGVTMGNKGNAGMAVLEFSRAFEDAQYGIRGVLNNIPGLIAMLGGGAGLAGVISVVAVIGAQLWERMSQGPKDAEKTTDDYIEKFNKLLKVYQDFEKIYRAEGDSSAKARAKAIASALGSIDNQLKVEADQSQLEKARIEAQARVELSQKAVDLAVLEVSSLLDGGKTAVELAKQRKKISEDILKIERQRIEAIRQEDIRQAEKNLDASQKRFDISGSEVKNLSSQSAILKAEADKLQADFEAKLADRLASLEVKEEEMKALKLQLEDLQKRFQEAGNEDQANSIQSQMGPLADAIDKLFQDIQKLRLPTDDERTLLAQRQAKDESFDALQPKIEESSKAQTDAAKAMTEATRELYNLRQKQNIERDRDISIEKDRKKKEQVQTVQNSEDKAVAALEKLTSSIGETGGKDLAPLISQLQSILADKALSAEELNKANILLAQYFGKVANMGQAQNEAMKSAVSKIDELTRDVATLKLNAKSR